ncbi:hypothetical protein [Nocardia brasiliensis]|uniref:hypothetical protein n=1 Tax=Nocardia brasiliensis TaxID=37326 RepID=UPI0024558734|nr:hypothetical protein [Nocardia brasiliensis]
MSQIATTIGKLAPVALVFGGGVVFARRKIIGAEVSKAFSDFAFRSRFPVIWPGHCIRVTSGASSIRAPSPRIWSPRWPACWWSGSGRGG